MTSVLTKRGKLDRHRHTHTHTQTQKKHHTRIKAEMSDASTNQGTLKMVSSPLGDRE